MEHRESQAKAAMRAALRESRALYGAVCLFSVVVNLLMLTGPLYMLNVYDRVLQARSVETLVALTGLVVFLYAIMGVLDYVRGRIMARVAARFRARLDRPVFNAVTQPALAPHAAMQGMQDLSSLERLIASPALMAGFDLPWVPLFFAGIFIFHPWLGYLAVLGAATLVTAAAVNHLMLRRPVAMARAARSAEDQFSRQLIHHSADVQALGMRDAAYQRWQTCRHSTLLKDFDVSDLAGTSAAFIKAFRLFLQSAMLGLGAYLVINGQLSAGAMIAGSILLGRALAPIEIVIGHWTLIQRARESWQQLSTVLDTAPDRNNLTRGLRPAARIVADTLTVIPPAASQAALRMINFEASAGQAIGVIGPAGAGKSTLARALTGVWPVAGGSLRLDGRALDRYDPDTLGRFIGYLPQQVQLFDGTISENIARLAPAPDETLVRQAARQAAVDDMILSLPDGYDTKITASGGQLSGGQMQRIGLARALYGGPGLLVLDEPEANLDHDGLLALTSAIRAHKAAGGIVFIMTHRPAAIAECDMLLAFDRGIRRAFGPKDAVLAELVVNHSQIRQTARQAAGTG